MGLAGRKVKQRIGADPRNLTWSDDSSKFGAKYLQSLGWTSGTGLGTSRDGRTSNLKIHQKLDLMGIGANRRGPGGDDAGWRGGHEFEGLLARLNRAQNDDTQDIPIEDGKGQVIDTEEATKSPNEFTNGNSQTDTATNEKKKRKRSTEEGEPIDKKEAKRRRKEEKKEKKEKRKAEKAVKKLKTRQGTGDQEHVEAEAAVKEMVLESSRNIVKSAPHRAHRARHLASKRLAAASAISMNEILGIASSTSGQSSIPFPSADSPPQSNAGGDARVQATDARPVNGSGQADCTGAPPRSTAGLGFGGGIGFCDARGEPLGIAKTTRDNETELLRKSGKSVSEYFAEKMRLKGLVKSAPLSEVALTEETLGKKKGKKE